MTIAVGDRVRIVRRHAHASNGKVGTVTGAVGVGSGGYMYVNLDEDVDGWVRNFINFTSYAFRPNHLEKIVIGLEGRIGFASYVYRGCRAIIIEETTDTYRVRLKGEVPEEFFVAKQNFTIDRSNVTKPYKSYKDLLHDVYERATNSY